LTHGTGAEVRHRLAVILGLAVCAVLAGACSFTAIAEWAADADAETLARLGAAGAGPSGTTLRPALQRVHPDALDDPARPGGQPRPPPRPRARPGAPGRAHSPPRSPPRG